MVDQSRIHLVMELLAGKGLDAVFLAPSSDLKYVIGLDMKPDSRPKGVLLTKDGAGFFLCPSLYRDRADRIGGEFPVLEWADGGSFRDVFKSGLELARLPDKPRIAFTRGIEAGDMIDLVEDLGIDCVNGFSLVSPLRSVKSPAEQELMRKASRMNDEMMAAARDYIRPGVSERDIIKFVMNFHESHGGSPRVPGVATGLNSANAHYARDNNRAVAELDVVMIDSGGWYEGYSHDMTRTFFVGAPSDEQRLVYETVLEAQLAAEAMARAGAIPRDLDRKARGIISAKGYGEAFNHRLGHGIGMDGHEEPFISEANATPLAAGNCFSIEPGIYLKGKFGVRIEDLVMLTDSGPEILNHFPKELTVL